MVCVRIFRRKPKDLPDSICDSVFLAGESHRVCRRFADRRRVSHRDSDPCFPQHFRVIVRIPECRRLFRKNSQIFL